MAFHPYPQLIQAVFNPHWFGPPLRFTVASSWSRIDHPVSRLFPATYALFRLGFPTATPHGLTLPRTVTRRLILQKARCHPERLQRLVSTRFQALFHDSSPECFSSFPHGTSSLSVTREYLGLASGLARFTRNFTVSVLLGKSLRSR